MTDLGIVVFPSIHVYFTKYQNLKLTYISMLAKILLVLRWYISKSLCYVSKWEKYNDQAHNINVGLILQHGQLEVTLKTKM